MRTSIVQAPDGTAVLAQGFRGDEERAIDPYVFVGIEDKEEGGWIAELSLSPENAQILGEELRKHAEYATTATLEDK